MAKLSGNFTCKSCLTDKDLSDFYLNKSGKPSLSNCKICASIKSKARYRALSPEAKAKKSAQQATWIKKNPEKRKATINRYHESHKEQESQYYLDNRDYILERESLRRQRPHVIENRRVNSRKYRKNPANKLHNNVSTLIRHHLKKNGGDKNGKSILNCLGYSIEELNIHLESLFEPWMNWDNHGVYDSKSWDDNDSSTWTWQIDHIKPVSEFCFTSMDDDQFKECWKRSNLRPLIAKENILLGSALGRKKTKAFVDT